MYDDFKGFIADKRPCEVRLVKDYFKLDLKTAVVECRRLSKPELKQLATEIAKGLGLTEDECSFCFSSGSE